MVRHVYKGLRNVLGSSRKDQENAIIVQTPTVESGRSVGRTHPSSEYLKMGGLAQASNAWNVKRVRMKYCTAADGFC